VGSAEADDEATRPAVWRTSGEEAVSTEPEGRNVGILCPAVFVGGVETSCALGGCVARYDGGNTDGFREVEGGREATVGDIIWPARYGAALGVYAAGP